MSESAWYRSLYWRIALGFVGFLAAMLLAQGLLFLWLAGRATAALPRSPARLARLVASELSTAIQSNPALDVARYVGDEFGQQYEAFLVVMANGQVVVNRRVEARDILVDIARRRLARERFGPRWRSGAPGDTRPEGFREPSPEPRGEPGPELGTPPGPGMGPRPGMGPGMGSRLAEFGVVRLDGQPVGVVVVPSGRPPLFLLLRELGPTMALAGLVLLVVGTALVAIVVFRPARRRLDALEAATTALGAGDMSVRAPESGGDEVSRLARAFNRMAGDLDARARELAVSDKARRQLLADVSHELMTPLTAMRGYLETLGMADLPLDAATRERYLQIVDEETLRMERIVGGLLDLARLEGGGGNLSIGPVPVERLFGRVAARHERTLHDKRMTLETHIAPGAATVRGDEERLEQALQNLAANALRHTPEGGRLVLTAAPHDGRVSISVRDTGPGIAPEHLPLIFDRFYKADAARESTGHTGSGLGLSIVKAIVERHGGTITAANAPEGGAVFEVVLDRA